MILRYIRKKQIRLVTPCTEKENVQPPFDSIMFVWDMVPVRGVNLSSSQMDGCFVLRRAGDGFREVLREMGFSNQLTSNQIIFLPPFSNFW